MSNPLTLKSNKAEVLQNLEINVARALTVAGDEAVNYAGDNIKAYPAWATGELYRSIDKSIDMEEQSVTIGSALDYAPYVEFGTGIYYEGGGRQTPWFWQDEKGNWHKTSGMEARPYLKPALADNMDFYKRIMEEELKG